MAQAQTEKTEEKPEENYIEALVEQESIAMYDIPDDILEHLNKNPGLLRRPGAGTAAKPGGKKPTSKEQLDKKGVHKMQGFRVQVFGDGSNPATLQARARTRGNMIASKFPKYRGQIYSFSASPNWYTRVGNFKTQQEANAALAELKRAFPNFAAEMRVVKSPITIINK